MKLLLLQYEYILQNFIETEGANKSDLAHAIKEHSATVKKDELLPIGVARRLSKCDECDQSEVVLFSRIDGAFCKECGCVFPF